MKGVFLFPVERFKTCTNYMQRRKMCLFFFGIILELTIDCKISYSNSKSSQHQHIKTKFSFLIAWFVKYAVHNKETNKNRCTLSAKGEISA